MVGLGLGFRSSLHALDDGYGRVVAFYRSRGTNMNGPYHINRSGDGGRDKRVEETNPTTSEMESWKSKIQTIEEAINCRKQGLGSFG